MVTKVKVEGTARLSRTLKEAGAELEDLTALNTSIGATVRGGMAGMVPVESGRLAGSLTSRGTPKAAVIKAGGADVPYAGVIEFGWPARNIAAQPYAIPAVADSQGEIEAAYVKQLDQVLAKVKGA